MCRHRQQVQRWGQMLRNSEHPQPSELCARETQWQQLPDAEISSFIPPPIAALPKGGRRAVPLPVLSPVSSTGCEMLGCKSQGLSKELARKT